jgi:hypothetical protein
MRDMVAEKALGIVVGPEPLIASKLVPTVAALFL